MKIELKRYGDRGWEFVISWHDPVIHLEMKVFYRTNGEGLGLWRWCRWSNVQQANGTPYKQIKDIDQFSLPENHKRAYDAIRYRWKKAITANEGETQT